jgi:hypothetical protein
MSSQEQWWEDPVWGLAMAIPRAVVQALERLADLQVHHQLLVVTAIL